MKIPNLLSDISRQFLKDKKVNKYQLKSISDMTENEVISSCHAYCEDNNLTEEFYNYREKNENEYNYCSYCCEYIEPGLCCDFQMVADGYVNEKVISDYKIDREKLIECCKKCRHCL